MHMYIPAGFANDSFLPSVCLILVFFLYEYVVFFISDNAGVIVNPKGEMKGNV